jgi:thymidylate kinase
VIALLVDPSTSSTRAESKDTFEADSQLASNAHRNYLKYAKTFRWKVIDGSKSKEHVHREIMRIVRKELKV